MASVLEIAGDAAGTMVDVMQYMAVPTAVASMVVATAYLGRTSFDWAGSKVEDVTNFARMGPIRNVVMAARRAFGTEEPGFWAEQKAMPVLPIPTLRESVYAFLESVRPLLSDEDYAATELAAERLLGADGHCLQAALRAFALTKQNYTTDIWLLGYLLGRRPLSLSTNWYGTREVEDRIYSGNQDCQVLRAATLIANTMRFREKMQVGDLPGISHVKGTPIAMDQFPHAFGDVRIPQKGCDRMESHPDSKHIIVSIYGRYYPLYVYDARGEPYGRNVIYTKLKKVKDHAEKNRTDDACVGLMTFQDRDIWADDRAQLLEKNEATLRLLETSLAHLVLDDFDIDSVQDCVTWSATGSTGRWADKKMQLCIARNGVFGANIEHTSADATIEATILNYALQLEKDEDPRETKTEHEVFIPDANYIAGDEPEPEFLKWELDSEQLEKLGRLKTEIPEAMEDYDVKLLAYRKYGAAEIKTWNMSPDAVIQMAIQLAQRRCLKKDVLVYETAAPKGFREGRTDTIRSFSTDSKLFLDIMQREGATDDEKRDALRAACAVHVADKRRAMMGKAFDRHLFVGIRAMAEQTGRVPDFFSSPGAELGWDLATSQTPCPNCNGGGFPPVTKEGFGVSYDPRRVADKDGFGVNFHISRFKSGQEVTAEQFGAALSSALDDIHVLFEGVA